MNGLPVGPRTVATKEGLDKYFADLERWNFDVPYNAFYAHPMRLITGEFRQPHIDFTRRAKEIGLPACIQIQISVARAEDIPVEGNAQYYHDDTPDIREHWHPRPQGSMDFFASFASQTWRKFLKNLISIFRHYGYNWVVFEEPMLRTDIPGKKDPLYELYRMQYPGREYPGRTNDSEEYYLLQRLKRDVLVDFFRELTSHARKEEFDMIGCMPWFFTPTHENTPWETWAPSSDQGRLAYLENMDFLVVRMQPDNPFVETTISEGGEALPRQAYIESMAHHFGKPIMAVNNPTNEHNRSHDEDTLIPYDYFAPYTCAAAAASPHGMTRHWYAKDYDADAKHMKLMTEVNELLPRLSTPVTPYAIVFSYAGVERILPRGWRQTWKHLYFMLSRMVFSEGLPLHILFGESAREQIERCPELECIFLTPFFPLPPEEVAYLKKWVSGSSERRLVFLGAHNGVSFDIQCRHSALRIRPNEVVELFGIDATKHIHIMPFSNQLRLVGATEDESKLFWGKTITIRCGGFPQFCFNEQARKDIDIIYRTEAGDPVVFEKTCGRDGGRALFIGCSLDGVDESFPLNALLKYLNVGWRISKNTTFPLPPLTTTTPDTILWNLTNSQYLVVSNIDSHPSSFRIRTFGDQWEVWDIKSQQFISVDDALTIPGYSVMCFRLLEKHGSLIDVSGQIYLNKITEENNNATIRGYFKTNILIVSRTEPTAAYQGDDQLDFESVQKEGFFRTNVLNIPERQSPLIIRFS